MFNLFFLKLVNALVRYNFQIIIGYLLINSCNLWAEPAPIFYTEGYLIEEDEEDEGVEEGRTFGLYRTPYDPEEEAFYHEKSESRWPSKRQDTILDQILNK